MILMIRQMLESAGIIFIDNCICVTVHLLLITGSVGYAEK